MEKRKNGLTLNEEEIKALKKRFSQLKTRKNGYIRNRIRAILMIGEEKKKQREVTKKCKIGTNALNRWIRNYKAAGLKGLIDKPRPGKKSKLTKEQKEELKKIIEAGPVASGYDSGIWTCTIVSNVMYKKFNVKYSISHVSRILHSLNFSYQNPKKNYPEPTQKNKKTGWRINYRKSKSV